MTDLVAMAAELKLKVKWQNKIQEITTAEYITMIIESIRELYIRTGRRTQFTDDLFTTGTVDSATVITGMTVTLEADEYDYVMYGAQIRFFEKVRTVVNNVGGYSTNALTVTHQDKPYQYLTGTIEDLKREKNITFTKMVRYTML